jgi:hypothetical protein
MGILDLFIEKTEDDKPKEQKSTVPPIGTIPSSIPSTPLQSYTTPGVIDQNDIEKFNVHFEELFQQANLPGPDYFEFSKMCQAMSTLPDDTKFPAIFGGLSVQGLTKQSLLDSANHYINIIDEDAKKFAGAIDGKLMAEVKAKRASAETKKGEIAQKNEMIAKLQAEVQAQYTEITTLEMEATDQEQKANQKLLVYKSACENRKNMINLDVQKINSLIK